MTETITHSFEIAIDRSVQTRSADALPVVIATDRAVDMGGYLERLDHSPGAVDLSRAEAGGLPFLHSHNRNRLPYGRVTGIFTDGHKLHGHLKLGSSAEAQQVGRDIEQGTLKHVSVGYRVHQSEKRGAVVHVTRWEPFEVSAVAVPADPAAKIGDRGFDGDIHFRSRNMTVENTRSLDLSPRDRKNYSLARALLAQAMPGHVEAPFERECSEQLAQRWGTPPRGLYIPDDVFALEQRDIETSGSASNLVATNLLAGDFIELLRNEVAVIKLGATILDGQHGNVVIPTQTAAASVAWVGEEGAPPESDQTFAQISINPSTLAAWTTYSRKTLLQATPAIDRLISGDLTRIVGIEVDRVAISGSGTAPQPAGVLNTSGIGSVALGTNGGAPTWAGLVSMIEQLANANALRGKLGFLTNSKVIAALQQTPKIGTTFPVFLLEAPYDKLLGYPIAVSNNIPSNLTKGTGANLSALLFGNWADLVIARWGQPLDLLSDPYSSSTAGSVKVVAFSTLGFGVRHLVSFCADVDVIAS